MSRRAKERFDRAGFHDLLQIHHRDAVGEEVSVLPRVMLANAAHIENAVRQIPLAAFERDVERLDSARRVYIAGLRASAPLALNFGLALRHIRPSCFSLQPGFGDLPNQLAEITGWSIPRANASYE